MNEPTLDHIDALCKPDSTLFKDIRMPLGEVGYWDMRTAYKLIKFLKTRPLVISTDLTGNTSDLYKSAKAGDVLLGKLNLGPADSKATFGLDFILPAAIKDEDEDEEEELAEPSLVVDLQLGILDKIKDDKEKKAFLDNLTVTNPQHLPLLVAKLDALKEDADPKDVSKAADAVLAQIDEAALSSYLGKKRAPANEQTKEDKKLKKDMDQKTAAWKTAYTRKIEASYKAKVPLHEQDSLFVQYRQFVDAPEKDHDFLLISAKRDFAQEVS